MKIAVLSDVHGYSIALERVLADISTEPDIDEIVVAGDLCVDGPDPAGALRILQESGATLLQGNTDRDLANSLRDRRDFKFAASELGAEGLQILRDLPFSRRITPPDGTGPDDDLLIVHANPFDMDRAIQPHVSRQTIQNLIGDTRAAVIAFGHVHISYIRKLDMMQLFNVSAAGNPKDGELRSRWGLATWANGTWTLEVREVPYPLEETIAQFEVSRHPKPEKAIEKLKHASYYDV